jgi:hypothetical protein
MTTEATNDTVARVASDYSSALAEPIWEKRKRKTEQLKIYAQSLTGEPRKIINTWWPDLLTAETITK